MKRGDIFFADLIPRSGSEQTGRRPVVIISHDGFNHTPNWRPIIVIPLSTSKSQARRGPTVVTIPAGKAGLTKDSTAVCHQVTTLDRAKIIDFIGVLPPEILKQVDEALKVALSLL